MNHRFCESIILLTAIIILITACAAPATPTTAPTSAPGPTTVPQPISAPTVSAPPSATTTPAATLTSAPTATTQAAATKAASASSSSVASSSASSAASNKVDMDKILPPGKGQLLVLNNCTSCHSFVCAVKGQRTVDYWQTIKLGHKERVSSLSDADFDLIFTYLSENFNDKKPVPELPPALQDLGCSAQ